MACAAPRFCLDQLPQQDQGRNHRGCFKIKIDFSVALERRRENSWHDYRNSAVEVSGPNTHGDKGEHVEAAINNRLPSAREEKAARPKDYWCC
jgi:hypothetical protein